MTPEHLVQLVKAALPRDIRSIVLYGSAAAGDFIAGESDFDVLIVAQRLGLAELGALNPAFRQWVRAGNTAPRLMTTGQLAASVDAFPIELMDLCRARRVLHGEDPLHGVSIPVEPLRIQLERELKGKLFALREGAVFAAGRPRRLAAIMSESVTPFLVLCRAAVRLHREEVPAYKIDAFRVLADEVGFNPGPFLAALDLKHRKPGDADTRTLFESYLNTVERIVESIDRRGPTTQTVPLVRGKES